jgi:acetyl-CoA carboxylase carboxyltransferase component
MECLLDPGSLQLLRTRVRSQRLGEDAYDGDGVLTGIGTVEGRPVACYAQDARVAAGSLGVSQADAIVRLLGMAREARMPVVSFLASSGARIQEAVAALAGYARVFNEIVALSRVVPQISIVTGVCAGGGAYAPALTDFVIMTQPAAMFLTGPRIVRDACGEDVTVAELGGTRVHRANGVCQLVAADDDDAAAQTRRLLSHLTRGPAGRPAPLAGSTVRPTPAGPTKCCAHAAAPIGDRVARDPGSLLPSRPSAVYDVRDVISVLADGGNFLETDASWARNMVTGFARIGGHAIAVVANQPRFMGGVIDTHASEKAAHFVDLCAAFGLPLVVLVDTPGFMPGTRQEGEGIIRHGAGIVRAFAAARVPRFTVILRKAYGGAYIAMNSIHLGASLVYAWPDAEIGVMDARSAVSLIHRATLAQASDPEALLRTLASDYRREHCAALVAAHGGFVDEVIAPAQTRARLCSALATFASNTVGGG